MAMNGGMMAPMPVMHAQPRPTFQMQPYQFNRPPVAPPVMVAPKPVVVKKPKVKEDDISEEEEVDSYQFKDADMQAMREHGDNVVVFCLKCEKHHPTDYHKEASCQQCCCCCMLMFLPPCCLLPYCFENCYERRHNCSECNSLLFEEVPGDKIKTQWTESAE